MERYERGVFPARRLKKTTKHLPNNNTPITKFLKQPSPQHSVQHTPPFSTPHRISFDHKRLMYTAQQSDNLFIPVK